MKTKLKKDRIFFVESVKKLIESKKATAKVTADNENIYYLPTETNELKIILRPEDDQKIMFSIFCRFMKPGNKIGNQYSGKWNFHYYQTGTVLNAVNDFELFLNNSLTQ